jgi:hypothetical protein
MYKVKVRIKGVAPLLQHKFPLKTLDSLQQGATKRTASPDYSLEWMDTMYTDNGHLVQPASHIEGAIVKAAVLFKLKGAGRKTYKDAMRAYCYVTPEYIPHLYQGKPIATPDASLMAEPTEHLRVDVRRVKVQRAAVARARLMVAEGWELAFVIEVHDDQVRPDVLQTILEEAGRAVGIGDFRPRYGRFAVEQFEVV